MDSNPVITALIGFAGGATASIIAPWVQWKLKKREILLSERKAFIQNARAQLETNSDHFNVIHFSKTVLYSQLKPYLSEDLIRIIEDPVRTIQLPLGGPLTRGNLNEINIRILDELKALELKWELI